MKQHRPLSNIAAEIRRDWKNVPSCAQPYLNALLQMDSIDNNYYYDTGTSVVRYFLANAQQWRGPVAKVIKAELKALL
jgi:hypothetical protein